MEYYKQYTPRNPTQLSDAETIGLIKFGKTEPDTKAFIDSVHRRYREVFNNNQTNGYKG